MKKNSLIFIIILCTLPTFFVSCSDQGNNENDQTGSSYTITFDKNDVSATGTMSPQTVASGATANLTSNGFSKTGWAFKGWAETPSGSVIYADQASYTMGSVDDILYAKWTNVTSISSTSATLHGYGNPNGLAMTGWFRFSSTSPGSVGNDTFGTRAPLSGGAALGSGSVLVSYTQTITGLTPNTTYYFCSIVQNSSGTTINPLYTFTTIP